MGKIFEDIVKSMGAFALKNILPAAVLLLLGLTIIKIVVRIVNKILQKSHLEKAAHSLITSVIKIVMGILLGLIVASCLGVDVTGVIALASVLTLSISLALQNALANVFGGIRRYGFLVLVVLLASGMLSSILTPLIRWSWNTTLWLYGI